MASCLRRSKSKPTYTVVNLTTHMRSLEPDDLPDGHTRNALPTQVVMGAGGCLARSMSLKAPGRAITLAADAATVFVGMLDGSIQIWKQSAESAGSFALDKTLEGHAGPVYALTVRAAGPATVLFSGSQDATAGIWSVPGGCRLCQLQQHKGPVNALALTKDGTRMLTGSDDGTVAVWDLASELLGCYGWMDAWVGCSCSLQLTGHNCPVRSLAVTADATTLVSGAADGVIGVWSLTRQTSLYKLPAHKATVTSIVLSQRHIFSASEDSTIRSFRLDDGAAECTLTCPSAVRSLALSRDQTVLVSGADGGQVTAWSAADPESLFHMHTFEGHSASVHAVALCWNSAIVWSVSQDQSMRLWRVTDLPHQQLAKSIVESNLEECSRLVRAGVVIPASGWDDALSARQAIEGHQMLMKVLASAQTELEEKDESAGVLRQLQAEHDEAQESVACASEEVARLNKALLSARDAARTAQERANKVEAQLMDAVLENSQNPAKWRLSRAYTAALVGLQQSEERRRKLENHTGTNDEH
mmetsp:Transcript_44296/g.84691  ORF Transcript_44296/g.84691 Transcript_44296/m.84691 type:complete len:530 (+) Transcript_44296:130-1719(+)